MTNERTISDEKGSLQIRNLAPGIVEWRVTGKLTTGLTASLLGAYDDELENTKLLRIFADWTEMTAYDSQSRSMQTLWIGKRSEVAMFVLVRSEAGKRCIGIMQDMLGGNDIEQYDNKEDFYYWRNKYIKATGNPYLAKIIKTFDSIKFPECSICRRPHCRPWRHPCE